MNESRPQLFGMLAGLFLAAGLVAAAMLTTGAWLKIKNSQFVSVKGSVQKNVDADLVVWSGSFFREAETLAEAQHNIQADREVVEIFLKEAGVTNVKVLFAPINIDELTATRKTEEGLVEHMRKGYRLTQTVSVESTDVDRLDRLDTMPLVDRGLVFTVAPPRFIYTKAGDTKIEMLAEATRDARARAEQIAQQGGRTIAQLQSAQQDVFQITPRHGATGGNDWQGENDMSSRQKTITAVVTASFLLK